MNRTDDSQPDDLGVLLAQCHEALVAGRPLPPETERAIPEATLARLRQDVDCLQRLERARRKPTADGRADPTPTVPYAHPASATRAGLTRLGRFELRRQLGHGGFGRVYLAWDPVLQREVALKVPHLEVSLVPDLRQRFLNEARAAAGLAHPHLVPVYEAGEEQGLCYIVSAYCPGSDLAGWLKERDRPVEERTAAAMVAALADAVHHVHERGIYHRDIKPGNVLLDAGFTPRLTDFGLAKMPGGGTDLTQSGVVLGTASYMAPEQVDGRLRNIAAHTDVYGLGALLYELLTGQPPFRGATRDETLGLVHKQPPTPPSCLRPGLCRTLEAICLKCLEKTPRKRYPSAAELADDLGRWMKGQPTIARPLGPVARRWQAVRRHPLPAGLALVSLLAAVLAFVVRHYNDPDRPLRRLEAELAAGRPVELIGETGRPGWFRWRNGEETSLLSMNGDGTFLVNCWGLGMLELLRDPPHEGYRFRAEIRHESSDQKVAEVGLYCACRAFPGVAGTMHHFSQVAFNDQQSDAFRWDITFKDLMNLPGLPPRPKGNQVRFISQLHSEGDEKTRWDCRQSLAQPELFQPALGGVLPWRQLEVEVMPDAVRARWGAGRQAVDEMTREWVTVRTDEMLHEMRRMRPEDRSVDNIDASAFPRGSLGLLLYKSSASFRRVAVEPLDRRDWDRNIRAEKAQQVSFLYYLGR
jgi:serine/threonine-protein kinase